MSTVKRYLQTSHELSWAIRRDMKRIGNSLNDFFILLRLSGKSLPRIIGVTHKGEVCYQIDVQHGFLLIHIIPVSYMIFFTRYRIFHYKIFERPKTQDKLFKLKELPEEFAEIYDLLGDLTKII